MSPADADEIVLLVVAGLAGLAVLGGILSKNPVRGLYLYIFSSAVLLSPELPVVRDKLSIAEPILACTLVALFLDRRRVAAAALPVLPAQRAALTAGLAFLGVVAASAAVNFLGFRLVDVRRTALETATLGLGLTSCAAVTWSINSWDRWLKALGAWAAGGTVVTAVGLMAMFVYTPEWSVDDFTGRVSSTLRESGQVASYLGPVLPLAALALERTVRRRWVKLPVQAVFMGAFVVMLGTGSRIALLISILAFCGLIVVLLADARSRGRGSGLAAGLVAAGAVGFASFLWVVFSDQTANYQAGESNPVLRPILVVRDILQGRRDETGRLDATIKPIETFENHPVLGIGPGNYGVYYRTHEVHNSYLAILGETGLLGVVTFATFLVLLARCGLRGLHALRPTDAHALGLAFLFGFGLLLLYQMTALGLRQRPLWFAAGLLIALPRCAADLRLRIDARARRLAASREPA